jgi:ankyrin repeat protein
MVAVSTDRTLALLCTALHYAAEAGHTSVVASLVIAGSHVHARTSAGWTAAHLAAYNGHTDALEKLLVGGYEVDHQSGSGAWTALHLAARHGHVQVPSMVWHRQHALSCTSTIKLSQH